MTDQTPNTNQSPPPPAEKDWRQLRHEERMKRREERWQMRQERWQMRGGRMYGWFFGVILVVLGAIFLLENMGIYTFANWWALLILIPAFWSFMAAWNIYHYREAFTAGVVTSLVIGILLTLLTVVFLFNLTLGIYWPVLLIVAGLVVVISAFFPR